MANIYVSCTSEDCALCALLLWLHTGSHDVVCWYVILTPFKLRSSQYLCILVAKWVLSNLNSHFIWCMLKIYIKMHIENHNTSCPYWLNWERKACSVGVQYLKTWNEHKVVHTSIPLRWWTPSASRAAELAFPGRKAMQRQYRRRHRSCEKCMLRCLDLCLSCRGLS